MVVKSELHEHGRECLNGLNALQKVLSGHFFWSFLWDFSASILEKIGIAM